MSTKGSGKVYKGYKIKYNDKEKFVGAYGKWVLDKIMRHLEIVNWQYFYCPSKWTMKKTMAVVLTVKRTKCFHEYKNFVNIIVPMKVLRVNSGFL